MKTIKVPIEFSAYVKEIAENIRQYQTINKASYKQLNFYTKEFKKFLEKEYPNINQNLEVSYDIENNQLYFYDN